MYAFLPSLRRRQKIEGRPDALRHTVDTFVPMGNKSLALAPLPTRWPKSLASVDGGDLVQAVLFGLQSLVSDAVGHVDALGRGVVGA